MGELPGDPCLAEEALPQLGILFELRQHQLDRDLPPQLLVQARIHRAHRPLADTGGHSVTPDPLREHGSLGCRHFPASYRTTRAVTLSRLPLSRAVSTIVCAAT